MTPEHSRGSAALQSVATLADGLHHHLDVVDLLTEITHRGAQLLGIASVGLLLANPQRRLQPLAATSEETLTLHLFQLQSDQGPDLDCFSTGEPVSVADLGVADPRWPGFGVAATQAGFGSAHAFPVLAAGNSLGVLSMFGADVGALSAGDRFLAQTLAHAACVAILQNHTVTPHSVHLQLRATLASRIVVEQARGFLRESLDLSVDEAFTVLSHYARTQAEHVAEIARRLLNEPEARSVILAGMRRLSLSPTAP